jgi:small-conductance mechanosensitive channel
MKQGCGCVAGIILVVVGLIVLVPRCSDYRNRLDQNRKAVEREKQRDTLESFAASSAPDLLEAIQSMDELEQRLEDRINRLAKVLDSMSRDPGDDADYRRWQAELENVRKARAELEHDLEEAYIVYKKFELSPGSDMPDELENALKRGKKSANEIRERYATLKNELEAE